LLLSHLLHQRGIRSVVVERESRAHIEGRIRAGVLEQGTVDTLVRAGLGARLLREGMLHHGIELRFGGRSHRIAFEALVPGRGITIYGQHELIKDLVQARLLAGASLFFEAASVVLSNLDGERPQIEFAVDGRPVTLSCDVVVGCDGSHGVSRGFLPNAMRVVYDRHYPFAWLGILARVAPSTKELIYAQHERGFALHSMRSLTLSRFYLQVRPDERIEDWPDARIWSELRTRLETVPGWRLTEGPIAEKNIAAMHSRVVEPLRAGRLFLAGDAAHVVPATGAKGLNLAVADVRVLSRALAEWYTTGDESGLERYSPERLRRVWQTQHFSSWMTELLHTFERDDAYKRRLQQAQLDYVVSSRAASTVLAENYVGLESG
jgi:p-hydroxybenzoate 3-monooxygenase